MMEKILENLRIEKIARSFLKAPYKLNGIHEADAELIDLGKGHDKYLALTTDALVEEVANGLYDDPYLLGWMLAMSNFSDLAAVGAEPLGLLISISYPSTQNEAFMTRLAKGISDACQELKTFVLGGDTNEGKELLFSGCAVGLVPKKSVITRMGAQPKDRLYLSGPAGLGSIFAFLKLSSQDFPFLDGFYQPKARIEEGKIIREYASSCMDTSDGVIHTVDTLMRLNCCRFILGDDWDRILHPIAWQLCQTKNLPPWLALAAVHGEFELCFTIRPQNEEEFLGEAKKIGWIPIPIGEAIDGLGVSIRTSEGLVPIDTALIRNISETAGSDPNVYLKKLTEIALKAAI
jgi:thiamine-monophosphate kinase